MSFPDKERRTICYGSRDQYWQCLDKHKIEDSSQTPKECQELRKLFEKSCPGQWVTHFDRKRDFSLFKDRMLKEGYDPVKQTQ